MRAAVSADRDWIEAKLKSRIHGAMFPLANLAAHGWESDAPRAMRFWLDREQGMLLGVSNEGMVMPAFVKADPAAAAAVLAGDSVIGVLGVAEEARALVEALNLQGVPAKLDIDEPQFLLDLKELKVPQSGERLVSVSEVPRNLLVKWRKGYVMETLGEPAEVASATAENDIGRYVTSDSHRVLIQDGTPVAITGINAALSDIVQIGGVYTPPELRGRGYARRAVGLHLEEARTMGVKQATLFASGEPAIHAYRAVGFRLIGTFALILFKAPQPLP